MLLGVSCVCASTAIIGNRLDTATANGLIVCISCMIYGIIAQPRRRSWPSHHSSGGAAMWAVMQADQDCLLRLRLCAIQHKARFNFVSFPVHENGRHSGPKVRARKQLLIGSLWTGVDAVLMTQKLCLMVNLCSLRDRVNVCDAMKLYEYRFLYVSTRWVLFREKDLDKGAGSPEKVHNAHFSKNRTFDHFIALFMQYTQVRPLEIRLVGRSVMVIFAPNGIGNNNIINIFIILLSVGSTSSSAKHSIQISSLDDHKIAFWW